MIPTIIKKIGEIGNTFSREFELAITDSAKDINVEDVKKVLSDTSQSTDNRFIAFFLLFTHYRKLPDFKNMYKIINDYAAEFESEYDLTEHVKLLAEAMLDYDKREFFKIVNRAEKLTKLNDNLKEQSGVLHHFAELTATYFERNEDEIAEHTDLIEKADLASKKAIEESVDKYGKFYATRARVLTLVGKYDEAYAMIDQAIRCEDYTKDNYTQIISRYEGYRNSIRQYKLKKRAETAEQEILKLKGNNIKILGTFAGFITFIIGNIQFIVQSDSLQIAVIFNGMFFTYFGLLLILLEILIPEVKSTVRRRIYWGMAIVLTAVGIVLLLINYL